MKPNVNAPNAGACPRCGHLINTRRGAMRTDGAACKLEAGDVTVCGSCATVLVFDTDLKVRRPTDLERLKIRSEPKLLRSLAAMTRAIKGTQRSAAVD